MWSLIFGFVLAAILSGVLRIKIQLSLRQIPIPLLFILLVALLFRAQPYLYVPGGQDQGVYVNMSATYEKTGSTFLIDDVRKKAIESGLKKFYDSANQMPGIYIKSLSKSEYVFQFYPLHPIWMAIAGKFTGKDNRVYSLVLFSLLSIVAFYLLAREFSGGNKISSVMVSLLLALNPLHAFFSKFPVTEVVTLAFSSLSFFYLVRYYNQASAGKIGSFYLVLSAMLFGCMFFTHIRGFLYIPFFYFLTLSTILFERNEPARRQLMLCFLSIFVLYALSVVYGMVYSYPYSHDIYNMSFTEVFHSSWQFKLTATILAAGLSVVFAWIFSKQIANLVKIKLLCLVKQNVNTILCFGLILVMAIAFYKAYLFAFTDNYIGGRWGIGGHGWSSLDYSNMLIAICYVSPLAFAIFVYSVFRIFPRKKSVIWTAFLSFLCLFWYYNVIILFLADPHKYFSARYLLSELVPYTLLATCLVLGDLFRKGRWWKITSLVLTAIIGTYFLYFTLHQFKGKSADGAHLALKSIAEIVGEKDLLLFYDIHSPFFLKTPLSLYYGLNTCYLENPPELASKRGQNFLANFHQVFFLTTRLLKVPFLIPIKKIQYKQGEFVKSSFIPTKYHYLYSDFYLYKVVNP